MGAHRMHVPEELAEYKLERAELVIALPPDWKLDGESMEEERVGAKTKWEKLEVVGFVPSIIIEIF